jgi:uncharacterized protein (TIGR03437 family)
MVTVAMSGGLCCGQGIINTVAGTNSGLGCSNNDGVQATSACIFSLDGIALDKQGNFYILTNTPAPAVRKVNAAGIITTVAGNGSFGSSGDGGPATQAGFGTFGGPSQLAIDPAGNLYIVDGNAVRMVNAASGIITTIVGNGTSGFLGDGGPATQALISSPSGIALDSAGDLYIADFSNNRVRKVDTKGTITTVAGNGISRYTGDNVPATSTGLALVVSVTLDSAGDLYISERVRIRKVDTSGNITTVAGASPLETFGFSGDGGPATAALLDLPKGMVFDSGGNLYFADSANQRIRKIDTKGIITTWAGVPGNVSSPLGDGGPAAKAFLGRVDDLVFDAAGDMYVNTGVPSLVRKIAAAPAWVCTNTAAPTITSIDSASAYGGYPYFASGSWLEIKGTNLADPSDPRLSAAINPGQWTASDFSGVNAPTMLDGVSVSIDGKPAYVWYLSPGQINVQAPEDSTIGNVSITVTNCNATSAAFAFARRALAPGLLAPASFDIGGTPYMVATFASDGAYVLTTSTGAGLGLNSRPAKPGDVIVAYGIGFGDVTPSILPGVIVQQSNSVNAPVTVSFGSANAALSYSGLAGNFVGLYEFYITVPAGLANGDYQINVAQNGTNLPQTMFLTVHN